MSERRLEGRYLCADLVRVEWIVSQDELRTAEAVLENISAVGACVQVEEAIPLGAAVSIAARSAYFWGFVSYCVYRDHGYFVGVQLSDLTKWSEGVFHPLHLTNVEELGL